MESALTLGVGADVLLAASPVTTAADQTAKPTPSAGTATRPANFSQP